LYCAKSRRIITAGHSFVLLAVAAWFLTTY
jgi:hypothetical protein